MLAHPSGLFREITFRPSWDVAPSNSYTRYNPYILKFLHALQPIHVFKVLIAAPGGLKLGSVPYFLVITDPR